MRKGAECPTSASASSIMLRLLDNAVSGKPWVSILAIPTGEIPSGITWSRKIRQESCPAVLLTLTAIDVRPVPRSSGEPLPTEVTTS